MDIEVSTIIGTETKTVNQVSSWRSTGITWVRSSYGEIIGWWHCILDIAYGIEELIERTCRERVAENLNNAGMNSTNSEANSEEPECVWTVLCQAMTQKSVRKAHGLD